MSFNKEWLERRGTRKEEEVVVRTRGVFITFEGSEGGGKTTQIGYLAERLRGEGKVVNIGREPGGTGVGEEIRRLLKDKEVEWGIVDEAELLLFGASRAQLVREWLKPRLERGEWVILDRYVDSTEVYQGYVRGIDRGFIGALNEFVTGGLMPDRTVVLDVSVDVTMERMARRGLKGDRFDEAGEEFLRKVREGYLEVVKGNKERVRLVDGSRSEGEVKEAIWECIKELL